MRTNRYVPMNSARSFCALLYIFLSGEEIQERTVPGRGNSCGGILVEASFGVKSRFDVSRDANRLAGSDRRRRRNRREPAVAIGLFSARERVEFVLQFFRDWPASAIANLNLVDAAHGRNLDRRAREENFIGDVEHLAGNRS